MPYAHPACQLGASPTPVSRVISPRTGDTQYHSPTRDTHTPTTETEHAIDYSAGQVALVRGADQEVARTASRRSGPRGWLRAVRWLIAAGYHSRANATTQRIADDLAARMDYTTGHVRYCLKDMVDRLGIPRATIARHVAYLRELGALAWVQHGTRANIRRVLGLGGYAATATVYAAVIPPVYDHAHGHRIVGVGYGARIVIDQRGQARIPTQQRSEPVDNVPVENPASDARETPSLTWVTEEGKLKVDGGVDNYTSRERASRNSESPTQQSKKGTTGRTPGQVAEDIRITRLVRALVNWTQREGLRRLAYALRPLIDRGLDSYGIAEYLHGMCSGTRWQPKAPASYIRTVLTSREEQARQQAEAAAQYELENPTPGAFQGSYSTCIDILAAVRQGQERLQAASRAYGWDDLSGADDNTWNAEADILAFLNGSPA